MQNLTEAGRKVVEDVARRHGVSAATVATLLGAVAAGRGGQAQFTIAELGGMGQWSRGGMTMVGDMFNTGLKARVDALCSELAGLLDGAQLLAPSHSSSQTQSQTQTQRQGSGGAGHIRAGSGGAGRRWPDALGRASSTGAQNDMSYAVFPETRRLAIEQGGRVTVYDTGDHRIGGVSQQQSGDQSLSFRSQHGPVRVADLAVVDQDAGPARGAAAAPAPDAAPDAAPVEPARRAADATHGEGDIFGKLERLADLRAKGILTETEFAAKKAELLARL